MKVQVVLALLMLTVLADNTVVWSCKPCNDNQICLSFSGGGFGEDSTFPTDMNSCDESSRALPLTLDFQCESDCSSGCLIKMKAKGQFPFSICSQTHEGKSIVAGLDQIYRTMNGDKTTYDWCNCGSSGFSTFLIVVVVIVVLGGGYWFFVKKRNESSDYSNMGDQNN